MIGFTCYEVLHLQTLSNPIWSDNGYVGNGDSLSVDRPFGVSTDEVSCLLVKQIPHVTSVEGDNSVQFLQITVVQLSCGKCEIAEQC